MSSTHLSTVHTKNHDYHHNDVSIDTDEHQCSVNAKHTHTTCSNGINSLVQWLLMTCCCGTLHRNTKATPHPAVNKSTSGTDVHTCSCCHWGVPAASWQRGTVPYEWRRGSGWAQSLIGWRGRLSPARKYFPSRPGGPGCLRHNFHTGRSPAGWWSPDWRWPQTSWQRRWAWMLAVVRKDRGRRRGFITVRLTLTFNKKKVKRQDNKTWN